MSKVKQTHSLGRTRPSILMALCMVTVVRIPMVAGSRVIMGSTTVIFRVLSVLRGRAVLAVIAVIAVIARAMATLMTSSAPKSCLNNI